MKLRNAPPDTVPPLAPSYRMPRPTRGKTGCGNSGGVSLFPSGPAGEGVIGKKGQILHGRGKNQKPLPFLDGLPPASESRAHQLRRRGA
jgi:hypothetical protein